MTVAATNTPPSRNTTPPHFFADLYSLQWSALNFRLPLISASAVGLCLFAGIAAGHPGGGLIAGGGAFTVGFGANQRIADSRLIPMMVAVFAVSTATLVGTLAGHQGYALLAAAGLSALIYGILTARNTALAWVGQQASIALIVASGFPTGPMPAFIRAGLLAAGGIMQVVITSAGLCLLPNLRRDLLSIPTSIFTTIEEQKRELVRRLRKFPKSLPAFSRVATIRYSVRLVVTILLATEVYRRIGIQSGYWIPMTALVVQKPAFFETLTRATARIAGTLAGAFLSSLLIAHTAPGSVVLAFMTALFAFLSFATNSANYALYSASLTAYIVFLLSLNLLPGPEIATRRALCTIAGGLIALVIHLDALRRHRAAAHPVKVSQLAKP